MGFEGDVINRNQIRCELAGFVQTETPENRLAVGKAMIHPDHVKILPCSLAAGTSVIADTGSGISACVRSRPHLQKTRNRGGDVYLLQATAWARNKPFMSIRVGHNGNVCHSLRLAQT